MFMLTIIEVGAHKGEDTELFLLDSNVTVFAFEPTPVLITALRTRFQDNPKVCFIPAAVDIIDSDSRIFHISEYSGCSSLYNFNLLMESKYNQHFRMNGDVQVRTVRLDTFMASQSIDTVDYLWIDAQGNDFNVLKSLGSRIGDVKAGRCEAANRNQLYEQSNDANEIVAWLENKGFSCSIEPQGDNAAEANVIFVAKDVVPWIPPASSLRVLPPIIVPPSPTLPSSQVPLPPQLPAAAPSIASPPSWPASPHPPVFPRPSPVRLSIDQPHWPTQESGLLDVHHAYCETCQAAVAYISIPAGSSCVCGIRNGKLIE